MQALIIISLLPIHHSHHPLSFKYCLHHPLIIRVSTQSPLLNWKRKLETVFSYIKKNQSKNRLFADKIHSVESDILTNLASAGGFSSTNAYVHQRYR